MNKVHFLPEWRFTAMAALNKKGEGGGCAGGREAYPKAAEPPAHPLPLIIEILPR